MSICVLYAFKIHAFSYVPWTKLRCVFFSQPREPNGWVGPKVNCKRAPWNLCQNSDTHLGWWGTGFPRNTHLLPRLKTPSPFSKAYKLGEMMQVWQISGWWVLNIFYVYPRSLGQKIQVERAYFFPNDWGKPPSRFWSCCHVVVFFWVLNRKVCVCGRRTKFSWITKLKTKSWCKLIEKHRKAPFKNR